jgi:hypothetical protein
MVVLEPIARAVREIKGVLLSINLVYSFLDTLIIFLLSFFITFLLNVHWIFALLPTLFYFLLHIRRKAKNVSLLKVEQKVESLNEELRTAADNVGKHNEIIDLLNKDVLSKMKQVKVSFFINFKDLLKKLMMMFFISFVIIFMTSLNVRLINFGDVFQISEDTLFSRDDYETISRGERDLEADTEDFDEIFGDASIAELGKKDISISLNNLESEIKLDEFEEVTDELFDNAPSIIEISAREDAAYDKEIAKEYKEVIKNYFDSIT